MVGNTWAVCNSLEVCNNAKGLVFGNRAGGITNKKRSIVHLHALRVLTEHARPFVSSRTIDQDQCCFSPKCEIGYVLGD